MQHFDELVCDVTSLNMKFIWPKRVPQSENSHHRRRHNRHCVCIDLLNGLHVAAGSPTQDPTFVKKFQVEFLTWYGSAFTIFLLLLWWKYKEVFFCLNKRKCKTDDRHISVNVYEIKNYYKFVYFEFVVLLMAIKGAYRPPHIVEILPKKHFR